MAALVQVQLVADDLELCWADELVMCHLHRVQGAIQLTPPEFQKRFQNRKMGRNIIFLPEKALQKASMIWHAIQNLRRCKSIAGKLANEIG